jgi:hypothetical protein
MGDRGSPSRGGLPRERGVGDAMTVLTESGAVRILSAIPAVRRLPRRLRTCAAIGTRTKGEAWKPHR